MRNLWMLFSLRMRRTWNARILVAGIVLLVGLTYLRPALAAQSIVWCLYATGLLSLQVFAQLLQLRRMPFARTLPRARGSEAEFLLLIGAVMIGLTTLWMVSVPRPLPAISAVGLGLVGYGVGLNPISSLAVMLAAIYAGGQTLDLVTDHPWATFTVCLAVTIIPIPFAARNLGLWGHADYRGAVRDDGLWGWRAAVATLFLRRAAYTQTESGRDPWTLANALSYEDAPFGGKNYAFRRWWIPIGLMAACLCLWLPAGLHLSDLDEYAFLVMMAAAIYLYVLSKFIVVVPRRGHLYPVARSLLLDACWLAHLRRMAGAWLTWAVALCLFCACVRWLRPGVLGEMAWYYPSVMCAFLLILPMPAAQWFAVHYGGDFTQQYMAADVKLTRSLLFLVNELVCMGLSLVLVLKALYWPPLRTAAEIALALVSTQVLLLRSMRRDMLHADRA